MVQSPVALPLIGLSYSRCDLTGKNAYLQFPLFPIWVRILLNPPPVLPILLAQHIAPLRSCFIVSKSLRWINFIYKEATFADTRDLKKKELW